MPGQTLRIQGATIVWVCHGLEPVKGRIGVAVILSPPILPDEGKKSSGDGEQPYLSIREVADEQPTARLTFAGCEPRTITLRVGDIIQFDDSEYFAAEKGGVAILALQYDVYSGDK